MKAGTSVEQQDGVLGTVSLDGFLSPSHVALVGASERSGWTSLVLAGVERSPGLRAVTLVNPRRPVVHGRRTVGSLADLQEPADLAFVMVGPDQVVDVVDAGLRAGTRDFVVLSAGLAESGGAGRAAEERLVALCEAHGARLLGPNVSGFVNAAGGVRLFGLPVPDELPTGRVGVVMQSGGMATHVLSLCRSWGVGLSSLVTTGNEAVITATDVIDHLVDDENTDVIAVFLESVRKPEAFRAAARRAAAAGKPVVALHVGSSSLGRAAALSHTGALVGDHATTLAALEDLGVVLVDTMEDLVATASLLRAHSRGLSGRRLAVVAASGGACELIADAAERLRLELPAFPDPLRTALSDEMPSFAEVQNPLDVTGFVVKAADLPFTASNLVTQHGAEDFDAVVLQSVVLPGAPGPDEAVVRKRFRRLAGTVRESGVPVVLQTGVTFSLSPFALELVQDNDLTVMPGIAAGMRAIERAARYGELRARSPRTLPNTPVLHEPPSARRGDGDVEAVLRMAGVPVPPTRLVTSADEAVRAAADLGQPVVLKVVSQQVAHKSDVGGVELDLREEQDVAQAFERMVASVRAAVPDAVLDGVSVTPMRPPGAELIVSVVNDPTWGPVLTVGSGGVLAELVADVAVRVGAVTKEEVLDAVSELRVARLLRGFRGSPAANLPAVASAVLAVVRAADLLGPSLRVLEVNPLWVLGDRVEALDVLVEWRED